MRARSVRSGAGRWRRRGLELESAHSDFRELERWLIGDGLLRSFNSKRRACADLSKYSRQRVVVGSPDYLE